MSRRHLTYVVVAFASMALAACSGSPIAPRDIGVSGSSTDGTVTVTTSDTTSFIGVSGSSTDVTTTPTDTTSRIGVSGSST